MQIPGLQLPFERQRQPLPVFRASVDALQWQEAARSAAAAPGRLVSLWGSQIAGSGGPRFCVSAAYALPAGLFWLELPLETATAYPALSAHFPFAGRMQRAIADLVGLFAEGETDRRPWLNHGAWPADFFPLRPGCARPGAFGDVKDYPFVTVQGDGVHEVAVGPVHAGTIEPGHFRFSVVGEKVLRLEERLGYTHKGIEKRFTELEPLAACRLAGRISGDSTVAFTWAYCMALEAATGVAVPGRAAWLRALMLERERVANHLGDLGALGNDAGLGFGLAQFSRLREDWLRASLGLFGHRFMMDAVVPGGVAADLDAAALGRIARACDQVEGEVRRLRDIYEEHAGLQDRFINAGRVRPELAAALGLTGLAGRASAQAVDVRCKPSWAPYDTLEVRMATHRNGDVAARVAVRFEETFESLRLIRALCASIPAGPTAAPVPPPAGPARGVGWLEGWRGEVLVALELDAAGRIGRCHCHDPSWQNWPVVEHAIMDNIVPDFPLINKSFNLAYSGHDL
jgi:Ni,Fe-hydrogenase III large subunit